MRIDGIKLGDGSNITNLTVASGSAFPSNPDVAELFFRTSSDSTVEGLYVYIQGDWTRIGTQASLITPNGAALPSSGATGQLFFLNSNDASEGLYFYDGESSSWKVVSGGVSTINATGDATGTSSGSNLPLTLATVNSSPGTKGSASNVPVFVVNGKGLVTSVTNTAIQIPTSQLTGTLGDAQLVQSNVTQFQAALVILESQITDGSILARLGSTETISAVWTFSSSPIVPTPTTSTQAANKGYADTAAAAVQQPKGGSGNFVFYENDQTVTANYSITAGKNAVSAGPISIANNITVTVPDGSVWTVV